MDGHFHNIKLWVSLGCRQRLDGGRGFGFTGAHFHWNWGHDDFRKLVLNALVWITGLEVPPEGIASRTPSVEDLEANQDEPKPAQYKPAVIGRRLQEWNSGSVPVK